MRIQTVGKVKGTLEHMNAGATIVIEGYVLLVTDKTENDDILCVELSTGTTHMIDKKQFVEEIETKLLAYTNYETLYAERRENVR